jgi:hypothetical protein
VGLAGPGGRVDDGDALAVGQDRQRGGGLVFAQAGLRTGCVSVWRVAGQRIVELREVGAEGARGSGAARSSRVLA